MNLIALDLPDDVSDWPRWLEYQLVDIRLRDLVQQLEAIQGSPNQPMTLDTVLADKGEAVLLHGSESPTTSMVEHKAGLLSMLL